MNRFFVIVLSSMAALSGCVFRSTTSNLATTKEDTYDMDDSIVVEASIRNTYARPITIERSMYNVPRYTGERKSDAGWENAIAPIVLDEYVSPMQLSPGESFDVVVPISATPITGPQKGTYRLVFDARYVSSREPLPKDQRTSNAFRIE